MPLNYNVPVVLTAEQVGLQEQTPRFALTKEVVVVWFAYLW